MVQKKEFMLLFRYEPSNEYTPTAADLSEQHQQWGSYIGNIALQEKLVSTYQLGLEGNSITATQKIKAGAQLIKKQLLAGNMVIKANGLEEATQIALDCPILQMGGTVEVRAITPM
jgi:hypothetical protein